MENKQNSGAKFQPVLVVIATIGTIVFNGLAGAGYIGGVTPEVISNRYPTRFTPAGYAFSIWALIYSGLILFSIYQALPSKFQKFRSIRTVYILSCAANCAWIYFWHHDYAALCLGIILLLLGTLAFINIKLQKTETNGEFWLARAPFGIYFGWVTAATIVNAAIALLSKGFSPPDSTAVILSAGLILIAAALGVIIRLKMTNYFYPLAIAWALTAIAVKQSGATLIVASAAVGVIACLIAAISFVMNLPTSEDRADDRA